MSNVIPIRPLAPSTPAVETPTREPIQVQITRYRCPSCNRLCSNRSRAREHMARCWWDPANRACKTCVHFDRRYDEYGDGCHKGVDLSGHPACTRCNGAGFILGVEDQCSSCKDVPEVRDALKPGPIVHCDQWRPSEEYAE